MAESSGTKLVVQLVKVLAVVQATWALPGCAAAFGQTDAYAEKLKAGCKSEKECQRLVTEADARVSRCKDNTIGYIRCSDAEADRKVAQGYLREYQQEREKNEQSAIDEQNKRHRDEMEKRDFDLKAAREQEVTEREMKVQQRQEQRKSEAASVWQAIEPDKCSKQGDPAACAALEEYSQSYSEQPHASEARVFARMGRELGRQRAESHEAASPAPARALPATPKPKYAKCCNGTIDEKCGCSGGAGCCFQRGGVCGCE